VDGPRDGRPLQAPSSWTGKDVPQGITPIDGWNDHDVGLSVNDFSANSVGSWCDNCVFSSGDVSDLNEHKLYYLSVGAMSMTDWCALVVCTYVFTVNMLGEIKDIELCRIAADRGRNELSRGWQLALTSLNLFRAHGFVFGLIVCIPAVIMTRGGDALTVAFNTVAIMFLTEVDNLSYQFALSEQVKRRVDEAGRVQLTDADERRLSRTKPCCMVLIFIGILFAVYMRSVFGSIMVGFGIAGLCKASEVLSMQDSSAIEKLVFLARCFFSQVGGMVLFMAVVFSAESGGM
jgi:hypothetical protein